MSNEVELLKIFLWIAFGGWGLYLTTERGRIVNDIKETKKLNVELSQKVEVNEKLLSTYWTTENQGRFEDRVTSAIDRLSGRIDKVLEEISRKA